MENITFQDYISRYSGQLVNSGHFIGMFYDRFNVSTTQEDLVRTWLHSPGVPSQIDNLNIIKNIRNNDHYIDVMESLKEITDLTQKMKRSKVKNCSLEHELR